MAHNERPEPAGGLPYRLGLPAWAFPGWRDRYFPARPSALAGYARVFNAVEGNTTFYRVPDERTIAAWAEAVADSDFRFSFKLPQTVTHERRPNVADLRQFLRVIEPLGGHLGPLLVQLPAWFGPEQLPTLDALLESLPGDLPRVLEVRHPAFFERPQQLEPLLHQHRCGRVMMDARPIHQGDHSHPEVRDALHEKPDVPVLPTVYSGLAFVRLVLHPGRRDNQRYLDEWAGRLADWLAEGVDAWIMIHCPNNLHCPELAVEFHETLRRRLAGAAPAPLPAWPVPEQGSLI
jgi:uncharacterized protein YecE (DUF72 family)